MDKDEQVPGKTPSSGFRINFKKHVFSVSIEIPTLLMHCSFRMNFRGFFFLVISILAQTGRIIPYKYWFNLDCVNIDRLASTVAIFKKLLSDQWNEPS